MSLQLWRCSGEPWTIIHHLWCKLRSGRTPISDGKTWRDSTNLLRKAPGVQNHWVNDDCGDLLNFGKGLLKFDEERLYRMTMGKISSVYPCPSLTGSNGEFSNSRSPRFDFTSVVLSQDWGKVRGNDWSGTLVPMWRQTTGDDHNSPGEKRGRENRVSVPTRHLSVFPPIQTYLGGRLPVWGGSGLSQFLTSFTKQANLQKCRDSGKTL